jgi:hypothetical protein
MYRRSVVRVLSERSERIDQEWDRFRAVRSEIERDYAALAVPDTFAEAHAAIVECGAEESEDRAELPSEAAASVRADVEIARIRDELAARATGEAELAYVDQLNELSRRGTAAHAAAIAREESISKEALNQLEALRPPKRRADAHRRLLTAFAEHLEARRALLAAHQAGDEPATEGAARRLNEADERLLRAYEAAT